MKTWRPQNWKNDFKGLPEYPTMAGQCVFETIFEAGADAILKALKDKGTHIENCEDYRSPCQVCHTYEDCEATNTGWLVFIPNE